jgi:hypothetical protein
MMRMLIKPFQTSVNASGQAVVQVMHNIHGLQWKVYQLGLGLGVLAPSPQVGAHVNGIPLAVTVPMQPSVFANILGQSPYAMESFMVGPPYIILSAGDSITCAVLAATPSDTFTVGAYVEEYPVGANAGMGA